MTAGRTVLTQSTDWCTPLKYVIAVKNFFNGEIELDPCSNQWSIVGATVEWSIPEHDSLTKDWNYASVYVNPPYGADRIRGTTIKTWLHKCVDTHNMYGSEVLDLVPVATSTRHWKQHIWGRATSVCFLYDTRLKFLEQGNDRGKGAPMACAMIYWGSNYRRFFDIFIEFGAVIDLRNLIGKPIGYNNHLRLI